MRRRKNKNLVLVLLLVIVGGLVGYAALRTTLTINGEATVAKNTWSVKFTTITPVKNDGTITSEPEVIGDTTFNFGVKLNKPGDVYKVKVKVENQGTIDAMLSANPTLSGLEDMSSYLEYSVKYVDGAPVEKGNLLEAGKNDEILVTLRFKKDISETDLAGLADADVTKVMTFSMTYIQADNTAAEREKHYTCKKAETLHTETCNSESGKGCLAKGYTNGATITYGHTDSSKLTNGQLTNGQSGGYALDCDISGNGDYERFYYVSDLYTGTVNGTDQFDSDYAVLIYHKNIGGRARYYYENSAVENWHGPVTLLSSLPTRSTWINENLGLKTTSRTIYTDMETKSTIGGKIENPFNYTGAVGRLLTAQEINKSCNITIGDYIIGELDGCEYLMEDSDYSKTSGCSGGICYYWLETPFASNSNYAWCLGGSNRYFRGLLVNALGGVRPAIEIKKTDISLK